jgi:hypothetical protein
MTFLGDTDIHIEACTTGIYRGYVGQWLQHSAQGFFHFLALTASANHNNIQQVQPRIHDGTVIDGKCIAAFKKDTKVLLLDGMDDVFPIISSFQLDPTCLSFWGLL